jgi:hypothetical protein
MNDVSILFPLPSDAADIDNLLAASSSGAMGTLLPSKLYAKAGAISGSTLPDAGCESEPCPPPPVGSASYSDLRVVAMRIDPCFASLAPDPHGVKCNAQIRLIFQQVLVEETGSRPSAFDSGLHVFYSLTRDEVLTLAQALVALRTTNETDVSLGPLAPHPILAKQGLGGPFSKGVEQLILKVAGEKNLTRVAALSSTVAFPAWGLRAANVTNAAEGAMSPFVIPTLAGDGGVTGQTVEKSGGGFRFAPETTSADNLAPLDDGTPESLSTSARREAFNSLVRVENPSDNSPNTIDCGSCHLASPTEQLVARPQFSLDDRTSALAFQPDGKSVVAADLAPTLHSNSTQLNMHAFSYVGRTPGISQRVVNETAAVVEYLNELPQEP